MHQFVLKGLRRAPIIKPLWNEFDRMKAARDAALEERDAALATRDAALVERDAALAARDATLVGMLPDIQNMREILLTQGDHSHTSTGFQDSLIQFIRDNSQLGGSVIEVGCYRGGLTAQLGWACKELDKQLFVVDVSTEYLNIAKGNLDRLVPGSTAVWFGGDLQSFLNAHGNVIAKPIVIFVDADHSYSGVVKDIKAVMSCDNIPHAVIFHDFGLRLRYKVPGKTSDIRVDAAIFDSLGENIQMRGIGEMSSSNEVRAEIIFDQAEAELFFEKGLPEGVIIRYSDIAESLRSPLRHRAAVDR